MAKPLTEKHTFLLVRGQVFAGEENPDPEYFKELKIDGWSMEVSVKE